MSSRRPSTLIGKNQLYEQVVIGSGELVLDGERAIEFVPDRDIVFRPDELLPFHPNGLLFTSFDDGGAEIFAKQFYSIGGGFIVGHKTAEADQLIKDPVKVEHPFSSGDELLEIADVTGKSIAEIVLANEHAWRTTEEIDSGLERIRGAMNECIERGYRQKRRAARHIRITSPRARPSRDPHPAGRGGLRRPSRRAWTGSCSMPSRSTRKTRPAAESSPRRPTGRPASYPRVCVFSSGSSSDSRRTAVRDYLLLTAGAIGMLYKTNASISGAEVGCQGEVGVACSMAAAGLAQVAGGTPEQVENAAEIGMEHNLGLTCDPIGGLVQIPCIERNAMAAVKAVSAARIALRAESKGNGFPRSGDSEPCARPVSTCSRSTRRRRQADSRSI